MGYYQTSGASDVGAPLAIGIHGFVYDATNSSRNMSIT